MDVEYRDFTALDELSNVTLVIEQHKLFVHREILATWSPVFRTMFTHDFKERSMTEIELPGKKVDDFIEFLHCMYPPIRTVSDSNVTQLLPLAEEYDVLEIKKRCEEYLLTKPGSMTLLVLAQQYRLSNLLAKNIDFARQRSFTDLQKDPHFKLLDQEILISILQGRVQDLEEQLQLKKKASSERDTRMYGIISDLASGYGNFCTECKSRKVNESCLNCLRMFRERVKTKCDEVKQYRQQNPVFQ